MKRLPYAPFLLLLVIASSLFTAPALAATAIGKVVAVAGGPQASGPGGNRVLRPGDGVFEKDRITTSAGANAQLLFVDGTKLVVGPSSRLLIDRFLLRSGNRARKVSIDALRGTFRFISGRSAKSAYGIQTANATIGIRGTAFDFASRGPTTIAVISGLTALCSGGDCTNVGGNCQVGRASGGGSSLLTGSARRLAIQNNLPFILNQSALSRGFRLNTAACGRIAPVRRFGAPRDNENAPTPAPAQAPAGGPGGGEDDDNGGGCGKGGCD